MMSGYEQRNEEFELSWNSSDFNFDTNMVGNINSGALNFEGVYEQNISNSTSKPGPPYFETTASKQDVYDAYTRSFSANQTDGINQCEFDEEPPLLEELGINTNRIFEKTLAVLNPFQNHAPFDVNLLHETDLAGPAALCVLLGACLLLAGGKAHFGYVYGLVMISCIAMYMLLTLMASEGSMSFGAIASVLGYCLLPVVVLSVFGVFLPLYSPLGFICAASAVMWSSLSASKLFVQMSGDTRQRPLIAYPCALLYGTFALIIVF